MGLIDSVDTLLQSGLRQMGSAMQILLLLMLLDELTGVARAFYLRRLSSAIGVHGLLRKGSIIVLIVAVHIIQPLIPGAPTLDVWFTAAFAFFELLSVDRKSVV